MRSYSRVVSHLERRGGGECGPAVFVSELDLTDVATATAVHLTGRRSYAVESALIGFDGIPALLESLEEMQARPLRWLGMTTRDGRLAANIGIPGGCLRMTGPRCGTSSTCSARA